MENWTLLMTEMMEILGGWHDLKPGGIVYEAEMEGIKEHEVLKITKKANWCNIMLGVDFFLVIEKDGRIIKKDKYGNHKLETTRFSFSRLEVERRREEIIKSAIGRKLNKINNLREQVQKLKKEL